MSSNFSSNFSLHYTFEVAKIRRGYENNIKFQVIATLIIVLLLSFILTKGAKLESNAIKLLVLALVATAAIYFLLLLFNFFIVFNGLVAGITAAVLVSIGAIGFFFSEVSLVLAIIAIFGILITFQGFGRDMDEIQLISY